MRGKSVVYRTESETNMGELIRLTKGKVQDALELIGVSEENLVRYLRDYRVCMPSKVVFIREFTKHIDEFLDFTKQYNCDQLPDNLPEKKKWKRLAKFLRQLWNGRPMW
jgi:hypothetical protein